MKIVAQKTPVSNFGTLRTGDVFIYQTEYSVSYFIKASVDNSIYNAINLHNGSSESFDYDTFVTPVNCELVVK
jgi:hypothetical protein